MADVKIAALWGSHCYDKTTEMSRSSNISHESKEPENHLQTKAKNMGW